MIDGYVFCATLQLRTPLRVLKKHGVWSKHGHELVMETTDSWAGGWMPALEGQRLLYGTMSSDIGPIPADGGDYLKFLIAVRGAAEADAGIDRRIDCLKAELQKSEWQKFIRKLGGRQAIVERFFPKFIDTIPGLPLNARESMWKARLVTPEKIASTRDDALLSIKGIGAAKLTAIRQACASAKKLNTERVDMVTR